MSYMKTQWQTTTLAACVQLLSGGTPSMSKSDYWEGDIPWVSTKDMNSLRLYDTEDHITEIAIEHGAKLVPTGTVLIAVRGMRLAKSLPIVEVQRPVSFNQDLKAIKCRENILPRFLLYWLIAQEYQLLGRCDEAAHGTKRLQTERLLSINIELPPLSTQLRIAVILTAYDDLIDNNTRRITLLEESIHRLYKEWFVYLRFPGCDRVKVVDGVPEGWRRGVASEAMKILSGGTPKTNIADYWDGKIPFFTPKDAPDSVYSTDTEKNITEKGLNNCNSRLFPRHTVFITARGTVGKLAIAQREMALNQSCYALQGRENISQLFLYVAMKSSIEYFRQAATGGVFDTIIVKTFDGIPFMIPSAEITKIFEEFVNPLFSIIENLLVTNQKLREARDLLLPRLMNGSIAV